MNTHLEKDGEFYVYKVPVSEIQGSLDNEYFLKHTLDEAAYLLTEESKKDHEAAAKIMSEEFPEIFKYASIEKGFIDRERLSYKIKHLHREPILIEAVRTFCRKLPLSKRVCPLESQNCPL